MGFLRRQASECAVKTQLLEVGLMDLISSEGMNQKEYHLAWIRLSL